MNFNSGLSWGGAPVDYAYIRCVRSDVVAFVSSGPGGVPPGRYATMDGTVYDTRTQLTWQQTIDGSGYTQAQAIEHCSALSLAGGGWRLPMISELLSIADRTAFNPAIDQATFLGPSVFGDVEAVWSSTVGGNGNAWAMNTRDGSEANGGSSSTLMGARCVR